MDTSIAAAFQAAPRWQFLAPSQRRFAREDIPLPIGFGVTNSQPSTVANMLELLAPAPGQKVLDVGAGSGWTTALIAELVGPRGTVIGVERIPELVQRATKAVARWPQAEIVQAQDGVLGLPAQAPYDRILVSAMAKELPQQLIDQLAPGGVLVVPVQSVMKKVERTEDGATWVSDHGWYTFVPLIP